MSLEPRICNVGSPFWPPSLPLLSKGVNIGPKTSWKISTLEAMSRYVATEMRGLTSVQCVTTPCTVHDRVIYKKVLTIEWTVLDANIAACHQRVEN
jgi:hypothetical protein